MRGHTLNQFAFQLLISSACTWIPYLTTYHVLFQRGLVQDVLIGL